MKNEERKLASACIAGLSILVLIQAALLTACANKIFDLKHELNREKVHPTYHCDGSDRYGYVAPGDPKATACWFETPAQKYQNNKAVGK